MSTLETILGLLGKWEPWKRLTATPDRVDTLEKRVAALEEKLMPATGSKCPSCGEMKYKLEKSVTAPPPWGEMGVMEDHFRCSGCGYTNKQQRS
ncbi:hypothetical protein P3G55_21955 [Leptospira sp. 96542]|nr:hypothetical protein [Leptospira sp. 96542]